MTGRNGVEDQGNGVSSSRGDDSASGENGNEHCPTHGPEMSIVPRMDQSTEQWPVLVRTDQYSQTGP